VLAGLSKKSLTDMDVWLLEKPEKEMNDDEGVFSGVAIYSANDGIDCAV
jgi:hypothetical protein